MQSSENIRRDLPADLDGAERDALLSVGMRLQAAKPPPSAAFRGNLRRRLFGDGRVEAPDIAHSRARAIGASYVATGFLLLAIPAFGLTGAGPLSP